MSAPAKNQDLHGNVPDASPVVLVLIDVINDLEFDGGDRLLEQALPMAERLADAIAGILDAYKLSRVLGEVQKHRETKKTEWQFDI